MKPSMAGDQGSGCCRRVRAVKAAGTSVKGTSVSPWASAGSIHSGRPAGPHRQRPLQCFTTAQFSRHAEPPSVGPGRAGSRRHGAAEPSRPGPKTGRPNDLTERALASEPSPTLRRRSAFGASTKARMACASYWLWRDQPSVALCATYTCSTNPRCCTCRAGCPPFRSAPPASPAALVAADTRTLDFRRRDGAALDEERVVANAFRCNAKNGTRRSRARL